MEIIDIFFLGQFYISITYYAGGFPHVEIEIQSFSEFALSIHDGSLSENSFFWLDLLESFSKSEKEVNLVEKKYYSGSMYFIYWLFR